MNKAFQELRSFYKLYLPQSGGMADIRRLRKELILWLSVELALRCLRAAGRLSSHFRSHN